MKYMGSKARIANELLPIILKNRKPEQYYVEPFAGGMNMIQNVTGNRIANDINKYLIAMFTALCSGWEPPKEISKEFYEKCKNEQCEDYIKGYVGFNCSYSGKWFGGYAGKTNTKIGTIRDYQLEAYNNIKSQIPKLIGIIPYNCSYDKLPIPENSIIYCDPPYENTTKYKDEFCHESFWIWCRNKKNEGHEIFISEYNAPDDFKCIWSKELSSSLSANGKTGGNKTSIEKLFTL